MSQVSIQQETPGEPELVSEDLVEPIEAMADKEQILQYLTEMKV